jgi:hypothetical protein
MSAAKPIEQLTVSIEFAGRSWTVHDRPTTGTSWTSLIDVSDYADYGVGLYKVVGSSSGSGLSCSGAALVDVQGNPLSTVAGLAGLGMAILGGLGLALLTLRGPASVGRRSAGSCSVSSSRWEWTLRSIPVLYPRRRWHRLPGRRRRARRTAARTAWLISPA